MYRIIYLSTAGYDYNFGMFQEKFQTEEEAIRWLRGPLGPVAEEHKNIMDYDPEVKDNVELLTEEYRIDGEYSLEVEVRQYGELAYKTEFKVVK